MTHSELTIREIRKPEEFEQLADLQVTVWGFEESDIAAPHLIMTHQHLGGVVLGAFDGADKVIAFTYSFFGLHLGQPIQWSHMLAVLPEYRGFGLGKALKLRQRELILVRGVKVCRWTFDPLEGLNARLNLYSLGATAGEYIVDAYGQSSGHLHGGLPTDRFVAHWELASERARACSENRPTHFQVDFETLPLLIKVDEKNQIPVPTDTVESPDGELLGVPIPSKIQEIKSRSIDTALRWREITRQIFPKLFGRGYKLVDVFSPEECGEPTFVYLLRRLGVENRTR